MLSACRSGARLLRFAIVVVVAVTRCFAASPPPNSGGGSVPASSAVVIGVPSVATDTTNRFEIRGMHCTGCARGIAAELKALPGVGSAEVDYAKKRAVVAYDSRVLSPERLVRSFKEWGYEAKPERRRKEGRP
ncbi:MAG: heavy-metal-associated domain-containing protein [Verrucomicrobiales bacterium]|nr:heavy-metal-associated domain-containing protein [Verrucomicrobiales bacterium]